jgi:hypothetical protein
MAIRISITGIIVKRLLSHAWENRQKRTPLVESSFFFPANSPRFFRSFGHAFFFFGDRSAAIAAHNTSTTLECETTMIDLLRASPLSAWHDAPSLRA